MKFSVITPTNGTPYLLETYKSLASQTHGDWEWNLHLNGKMSLQDLPKEIVDDPKVLISFDAGGEAAVGRVKRDAFMLGTGDVLVELDHDDILVETCLAELNSAYIENPDVGFVYSDDAVHKTDGEFVPYNPINGWTHEPFSWHGMNTTWMHGFDPSAAAMAFIWYAPDHVRTWRREAYVAAGGHDPVLKVLDDQDLLARTYLVAKFFHIKKPLYIYRVHGQNTWQQHAAGIQVDTVSMFHKYAYRLVERDADLNGLMKIELGGGINPTPGYTTIDIEGGHIQADLSQGIPLDAGCVGVIKASHVLEHLPNPLKSMSEIHRVLADGGWAMIDVPSTDGRGAWQDPTHCSYWNQNSFLYYTRAEQAMYIRNSTIKFQNFRCDTHFPNAWYKDMQIPVVSAWLRAIKGTGKRPHPIMP
jgi:SAM-dependent methyltransferase